MIRKVRVRQGDYYGGDLTVCVGKAMNDDDQVEIEWNAWGGYGSATIALLHGEARELAMALIAVSDSLGDDDGG